MKSLISRTLSFFAVYATAAAIAQAHPGHEGHDGGDFTWDFRHLATHPLATLAYAVLFGVAVWAVASHLRTRRTAATQSLRKSADR